MEAFQLPLREIQEKFTKSELVIMGWRSAEMSYKMRLKMKRTEPPPDEPDDGEVDRPRFAETERPRRVKRKEYADADVPANLPDRMIDEEGEVNLSKSTLRDAVQYMNAIGIKMPIPTPGRNQFAGKLKGAEEKLPTIDEIL